VSYDSCEMSYIECMYKREIGLTGVLSALLWTVVHDLSRRVKSAKTRGAKSRQYTWNTTAVEVSRTIDPSIAARVDLSAAVARRTPKLYISKCSVLETRPLLRISCGSRAADVRRPTVTDSVIDQYIGRVTSTIVYR